MRALDSEDCVKVEEGELEKKKKPFDKWLLEEVAEKKMMARKQRGSSS